MLGWVRLVSLLVIHSELPRCARRVGEVARLTEILTREERAVQPQRGCA